MMKVSYIHLQSDSMVRHISQKLIDACMKKSVIILQENDESFTKVVTKLQELFFKSEVFVIDVAEIANKTDVDEIAKLTKECDYIVVDSFQALTTKTKMNSLEKEKYALTTLVKAAQKNECCICFVMHLTKAGKLKGTTLVPHTVDANLNMLINGDDDTVRDIFFSKNRLYNYIPF